MQGEFIVEFDGVETTLAAPSIRQILLRMQIAVAAFDRSLLLFAGQGRACVRLSASRLRLEKRSIFIPLEGTPGERREHRCVLIHHRRYARCTAMLADDFRACPWKSATTMASERINAGVKKPRLAASAQAHRLERSGA